MKIIIHNRPVAAISYLTPEAIEAGVTIENLGERLFPGMAAGVDYHICEAADLPDDPVYRDAWTYDPGVQSVVFITTEAVKIARGRSQANWKGKYPGVMEYMQERPAAQAKADEMGKQNAAIDALICPDTCDQGWIDKHLEPLVWRDSLL
jgi:hypothetical protein